MTELTTDAHERVEDDGGADESRAGRAVRTVVEANGDGRLTLLFGGLLLARGLQSRSRSRWRAAASVLLGTGLLAVGLRQKQSGGDKSVSDEAHSAMVQGGYEDADGNPRDVTEEPTVDAEGGQEGGDVRFSTEQDIGPGDRPDIEDETGAEAPRRSGEDDVEIDISEAAMADEPSEAAGPSPEQAQPSSTEGTEPESTPEEDASHVEHDATASDDDGDTDDGDTDDREEVETEGGATVHTDTMEAGTTDIDEDDVTDPGDDRNEEPPDSEQQDSPRLDDGDVDEGMEAEAEDAEPDDE